jgi:MFS family permease
VPALARDLNVGLPAAGHLITAFSLAYAIGAPVMAVLTARLEERRRLLAVAMAGSALPICSPHWHRAMPGCWRLGCCWPCPPPALCQRPADRIMGDEYTVADISMLG